MGHPVDARLEGFPAHFIRCLYSEFRGTEADPSCSLPRGLTSAGPQAFCAQDDTTHECLRDLGTLHAKRMHMGVGQATFLPSFASLPVAGSRVKTAILLEF